jgi:DNA-directed RNA polymerase subunit F
MKIIKTRPATLAEAKELLEERKKEMDLEYEQAQAFEHAEKFAKQKPSDAEKEAESLAKKGKFDLETAVKLVDISPKHPETLKAVLARSKTELNEEEASEILKGLQK